MSLRLIPDQGGFRQIETSTATEALYSRAEAARDSNAAYLALNAPNAGQNTAQVQRLTRQVNALIALVVGIEDTAGT